MQITQLIINHFKHFVKTQIKDASLTLFCNCNAYSPRNLSDEEIEAFQNLSENTSLVIQKLDKENSEVDLDKDVHIKLI